MKAFVIFLIALGASFAARADTIDLFTALGFGALHQYHNVDTSLCTTVPCDPADQVTIYISTQASYTSPPPQRIQLWFGSDLANSYFGPYYGSGVPTTVIGPAPLAPITVTLNESSRRVCTSSGRGQNCHQVWTLLSGELVR